MSSSPRRSWAWRGMNWISSSPASLPTARPWTRPSGVWIATAATGWVMSSIQHRRPSERMTRPMTPVDATAGVSAAIRRSTATSAIIRPRARSRKVVRAGTAVGREIRNQRGEGVEFELGRHVLGHDPVERLGRSRVRAGAPELVTSRVWRIRRPPSRHRRQTSRWPRRSRERARSPPAPRTRAPVHRRECAPVPLRGVSSRIHRSTVRRMRIRRSVTRADSTFHRRPAVDQKIDDPEISPSGRKPGERVPLRQSRSCAAGRCW